MEAATRRIGVLAASLERQNTAGGAPFRKLMVANRGEIAIRIFRAAKSLGVSTVAVFARKDATSLHISIADEAVELRGEAAIGPYLDIAEVLRAAKSVGADAIHPGYGFLAESAEFAAACKANKIVFVGPSAEAIVLFGDKTRAKALAEGCRVPIAKGSPALASARAAVEYAKTSGVTFPVLIKAVFGGGGRGQRIVRDPAELSAAFEHCCKEAELTFGNGACFVEEFIEPARHVEVQILADQHGNCVHFYERDCSVQLRNQKVIEIAPPRNICPTLREGLTTAALNLAKAANYSNAGTVEFLVRGELSDPSSRFIFLEMNPRIQVEHTITEEVCGVQLVENQILIAAGATLASLGFASQADVRPPSGFAAQLRVGLLPGPAGPITVYEPPVGPGLRVDSAVMLGSQPSPEYDPMIIKLIVAVPGGTEFRGLIEKALAAITSFHIEGINTNTDVLSKILQHADFVENKVFVSFLKTHEAAIFGSKTKKKKGGSKLSTVKEMFDIKAPFPGQIAEVKVAPGDQIAGGQTLAVLSAMKMLNELNSPAQGTVLSVNCSVDEQVDDATVLITVEGFAVLEDDDDDDFVGVARAHEEGGASNMAVPAWYRADVVPGQLPSSLRIKSTVKVDSETFLKRKAHNEEMLRILHERLAIVAEGGGGKYVELHRKRGKMLPRERINSIVDPGSRFMELSALAAWGLYGGKIHSAAMVCGIGVVHGVECMFFANDATVKGGVFFPMTSKKQLRAQAIAQTNRLPCIYLVDGGGANLTAGGGSKEIPPMATFVDGGLQFKNQAVMSSMDIPQLSAVLGKCTAGGAYIPAMSDEVVIVKGNGTIYLGGPPLVKAATGEDADEQQLGGAAMHTSISGVADHLAESEEEALKKVRSMVEHLSRPPRHTLPTLPVEPPAYDREELLGIIPEDTKFPFDVREVIARVVDGSRFHEFKARYGSTLVCGFAHIHGYPVGILGNNGILFSESAVKGAHFVQICSQRGIPLVFMHNITGFIVGTQYEQGGIAKDGAKMIMAVSCATVPKFSIVLAGSHGAGNYAMCGPAFDPRFTFLWPNAKISVMGGKQAAEVVTIVKEAQLKREGKTLAPQVKEMMQKPIIHAFETNSSAYDSTKAVFDDGIIDPRDTRDVLGMAISVSLNAPYAKTHHGVFRM